MKGVYIQLQVGSQTNKLWWWCSVICAVWGMCVDSGDVSTRGSSSLRNFSTSLSQSSLLQILDQKHVPNEHKNNIHCSLGLILLLTLIYRYLEESPYIKTIRISKIYLNSYILFTLQSSHFEINKKNAASAEIAFAVIVSTVCLEMQNVIFYELKIAAVI